MHHSTETPFPLSRNEISFLELRGLFSWQSLFPTQGILRGMDYMGTTVFALSGTVTAGQTGMDLLGNLSHRAGYHIHSSLVALEGTLQCYV